MKKLTFSPALKRLLVIGFCAFVCSGAAIATAVAPFAVPVALA